MKRRNIKPLSFNDAMFSMEGIPSPSGTLSARVNVGKKPDICIQNTDRSLQYSKSNQGQSTVETYDENGYKEKIKVLERSLIIQQKEIERLKYINQYLVQQNQSKLELINLERKRHIENSNTSQVKSTVGSPRQIFSIQNFPHLQQLRSLIKVNSTANKLLNNQTTPIKGGSRNDTKIAPAEIQKLIPKQILFNSPEHDTIKSSPKNNNAKEALLKNEMKERQRRDNLFNSFLKFDECFKLNTILNMGLKDADAEYLYENDGTLMLIDRLLYDEETFFDLIQTSGQQRLSLIFDKLTRLFKEHKSMFRLILRMKRIIQGAVQMSQSVLLDETLNKIVEEILVCLECDRASCFIVDHYKNELWSKVAKGTTQTIRFPIGKGVAGTVAVSKELINIHNAYNDERFNQEVDMRTQYKTTSMLVCPILDHEKCIGVLQCVNKLKGMFTKDDEALLVILAEFSRVILQNAISHDEQLLIHNKLRHTIKTGILLGEKAIDLQELIVTSQSRLKALMNVDLGKIVLLSQDRENLIHCTDDGDLRFHKKTLGIIGQCIVEGRQISIFNCYNHPSFNPQVDISTHMPVVTIPIRSPLNTQDVIGALQVVNVKGVATLLQNLQPKIATIDQEVLEFFARQISQAIILNQQILRGLSPKIRQTLQRFSTVQLADDLDERFSPTRSIIFKGTIGVQKSPLKRINSNYRAESESSYQESNSASNNDEEQQDN